MEWSNKYNMVIFSMLLCGAMATKNNTSDIKHRLHHRRLKQICEKCPPGNYFIDWCRSLNDPEPVCHPCPPNTFRSHPNFHRICKEFTVCQELSRPGNATHDNKCKKHHDREPAIDAHHSMTGGNMSRSIDYTSSVETSNITSATVTVNYDPFQNMTSALDYNSTTDFEAVVGYNEVTLLLLVLTITAITLLFVAMLSMMYMKKNFARQLKKSQSKPYSHLHKNITSHFEKKQKVPEMTQENSHSFSFFDGGNLREKVMARNETIQPIGTNIHANRRGKMHHFSRFGDGNVHPNLETQVIRENETTKISVLKRSCSNVDIQNCEIHNIPRRAGTIHRVSDNRKSARFLGGREKKELMSDLQITPFVHHVSERQVGFTEMEISLIGKKRRKNYSRSRGDIKELDESETQTEEYDATSLVKGVEDHTEQPKVQQDSYQKSTPNMFTPCYPSPGPAKLSPSDLATFLPNVQGIPTIICQSGKESKIKNCNKYTNEACQTESISDCSTNHSASASDNRCHMKVFDSTGGHWIVPNSDVQLTVPEGAVPSDQHFSVEREVITDLARFQKYLNEDERFVAPIAKFVCENKFTKHVKVDIPHCLQNWDNVHIQWGDTMKGIPFIDITEQPKDNNIRVDAYYTIGPKYISIYTKHFTQFLCSEHRSLHPMQLEAVLLGKQSISEEQEIHMKLFFIDNLHQIIDMREHFRKRYNNFPLECDHLLKQLPEEIGRETELTVTLSPKGDWIPQTKADGEPAEHLQQSVKMKSILYCPEMKYMPAAAAEFVVVLPNNRHATHFKGDVQICIFEQKERKKKKTSLLKPLIRWSEKESKGSEVLEHKNTMWVNYALDPVFDKPQVKVLTCVGDMLEYIAEELSKASVKPLLRKLGLKETDWEQIQTSHRDDLREQKMQMLLLYQERQGQDFSVNQLLRYLESIGENHLSNVIRKQSKSIIKNEL